MLQSLYMGFPKIRGTSLGVDIIQSIVYWGLFGSPCSGKLPHLDSRGIHVGLGQGRYRLHIDTTSAIRASHNRGP